MKNTLKVFIYFALSISFLQSSIIYAKNKHHSHTSKSTKDKKQEIEKLKGIQYKCSDNQKFNIEGDIIKDNNINLYYNSNKPIILSRVDTQTGANRFINSDKGLDFVIIPTKSMLLDTKAGRRIADECIPPIVEQVGQLEDKIEKKINK